MLAIARQKAELELEAVTAEACHDKKKRLARAAIIRALDHHLTIPEPRK